MKLDWNGLGVDAKIGVAGKDLPSASDRNAADQEIDSRSRNAPTAAFVAPARGLFVITRGKNFIGKGSQFVAQSLELRGLSEPREQFLTDRPNDPCAPALS
jgi:hypothetical protein